MINILYCFDKRYTTQAFVSMFSVLQNFTKKVNFHIIYSDETNHLVAPEKIQNHRNLNSIKIYRFNSKKINYFNLENSHVSEATFYRIFLEEYIEDDVDFLLYLDCDVVCVADGIDDISENIKCLMKSNLAISAVTEFSRSNNIDHFSRISMEGEKYFNAGVMLINFKTWKNTNIKEKCLDAINHLNESAKYWDQDILNFVIKGQYYEMNPILNSVRNVHISLNKPETIKNTVFFHFAGSSKPWSIRGPYFEGFELFQKNFRLLFGKKYFLTSHASENNFKVFISLLRNIKILNIEYKILFLIKVLWRVITNKT